MSLKKRREKNINAIPEDGSEAAVDMYSVE